MRVCRSSHRWLRMVSILWLVSGGMAAGQPVPQYRGVRSTPESMKSLRLAEHNQLGVLEYCHAQGAIGEEIVLLQRAALARLPAGSADGADEREAQAGGRRGMVGFGSAQVPIGEAAQAEGMPVVSRCKQLALTVLAEAGRPPIW